MCIICIDFDRRAMSLADARRALFEMQAKLPESHQKELTEKLDAAARAEREAAANPPAPATPIAP